MLLTVERCCVRFGNTSIHLQIVKNTTGTYPNPIVTHVYVNQAEVMTADILCTNGYVHIIDQVLLPPGLELV